MWCVFHAKVTLLKTKILIFYIQRVVKINISISNCIQHIFKLYSKFDVRDPTFKHLFLGVKGMLYFSVPTVMLFTAMNCGWSLLFFQSRGQYLVFTLRERDTFTILMYNFIGQTLRKFTQLKRNKRLDNFIMLVWVQGSPFHIAAGSHPVQEALGVKFKSCFNVVKNHTNRFLLL